MTPQSNDVIRQVTSELNDEILRDSLFAREDTIYRPIPNPQGHSDASWRVRFELAFDPSVTIGWDVNGEVLIGRGMSDIGFATLFETYDADHLGISRRHALLRPADSKLHIIDLGSTNGTWLNGHSIGVNMPYSLSNGDHLMLGRLELIVKIVKRPTEHTSALQPSIDLVNVIPSIGKVITSQLERKDILKQVINMALTYTAAGEVTIWLVDEQTGELFLEAEHGYGSEHIQRLSVNDTLAGKVVESGKPLRINRETDGEQIKVKTGYLVDAVVYVPLTLAGVTFGVLSVAHREPGKSFSQYDENVMMAIANFTAVAIQNARVFEATERALARRVKVVTALNYALSYDVKSLLNTSLGYGGMLVTDPSLDDENTYLATQIVESANQMDELVDKLIEITTLSEDTQLQLEPCDLVGEVSRAIEASRPKAETKDIQFDFQLVGDPYAIQGDPNRLYRAVLNIIDNAIKYSPVGGTVAVGVLFWHNDIIIRVCDSGPGIPEDDLPYLFDRYFRSASVNGKSSIGLGLEIVRNAVEAHRGTVTARNAEDGGAEFMITLPTTLRLA